MNYKKKSKSPAGEFIGEFLVIKKRSKKDKKKFKKRIKDDKRLAKLTWERDQKSLKDPFLQILNNPNNKLSTLKVGRYRKFNEWKIKSKLKNFKKIVKRQKGYAWK